MKFAHILSRITGTPWLITQDALENINALLEARIAGAELLPASAEKGTAPTAPAGTKVIPIHGVIGKRLSAMEMMCGGADVDAIEAAFDAANNDESVSRIVLHVDSPGGTVTGVPELAQKIYDTKKKPVIAVTDSLMASAAYYLASGADEIIATPTANVGSIGVVLQVREATSTASADGRHRLKVFRSGEDKMMGIDAPLTESQSRSLQDSVDFLGNMFRADVNKARPRVQADSMTGRVYFGDEAVARNLADRVVPSISAAMS